MVRKLFVVTMLSVFLLSIAACNTMEGAGEDVEEGAEQVQDAAS